MRARRPLYFMAKPPPSVADLIFRLPRNDRDRPADLLHITLLGLVDLAEMPEAFLQNLLALMSTFEGDAFRVVFDRLAERRAVTLCGSERMAGAHAFQARLTRFLVGCNFCFFGAPPTPHVTINYRGDGRGSEPIDPISWRIDEVLAIESVVGKRRHIIHKRWPLRVRMD